MCQERREEALGIPVIRHQGFEKNWKRGWQKVINEVGKKVINEFGKKHKSMMNWKPNYNTLFKKKRAKR